MDLGQFLRKSKHLKDLYARTNNIEYLLDYYKLNYNYYKERYRKAATYQERTLLKTKLWYWRRKYKELYVLYKDLLPKPKPKKKKPKKKKPKKKKPKKKKPKKKKPKKKKPRKVKRKKVKKRKVKIPKPYKLPDYIFLPLYKKYVSGEFKLPKSRLLLLYKALIGYQEGLYKIPENKLAILTELYVFNTRKKKPKPKKPKLERIPVSPKWWESNVEIIKKLQSIYKRKVIYENYAKFYQDLWTFTKPSQYYGIMRKQPVNIQVLLKDKKKYNKVLFMFLFVKASKTGAPKDIPVIKGFVWKFRKKWTFRQILSHYHGKARVNWDVSLYHRNRFHIEEIFTTLFFDSIIYEPVMYLGFYPVSESEIKKKSRKRKKRR